MNRALPFVFAWLLALSFAAFGADGLVAIKNASVWEDAEGRVWLGYNDSAFLDQRYGMTQRLAVNGLSKAR